MNQTTWHSHFTNQYFFECSVNCHMVCTNFPQFYKSCQILRPQKSYMKKVPFWGSTNNQRHCTKFILPGKQTPRIFPPLGCYIIGYFWCLFLTILYIHFPSCQWITWLSFNPTWIQYQLKLIRTFAYLHTDPIFPFHFAWSLS
jgi:hypothetical protein